MGVYIQSARKECKQHMEVCNILLKRMYKIMCKTNHLIRHSGRKKSTGIRTVSMLVIVFLCAIIGGSGVSRNLISIHVGTLSAGVQEVQAAETTETEELQAGLMGVVSGAITLNEYSQAASKIENTTANEEVLVGAAHSSRTERRRATLGRSTESAGNVFAAAKQVIASNQMQESEYYTLLRIVEAEATGEDTEGKMLIANVILNRVKDDRFPDTIEGVVYQVIDGSAQFQPTVDGRIDSVEVTESTIEAVDRVLAGEDQSQGALFFMARNASDASSIGWFEENLIPLFTHGGHEYYTLSANQTVS